MTQQRFRSIRARLAWLVVICLLPVALLTTWLLWDTVQQKHAELIRDSIGDARTLGAIVEADFKAVELAMTTLASSPLIFQRDLTGFYGQSQKVLGSTGIGGIALFDDRLTPLMHTSFPLGELPPTPVNTKHLKRALASGQPQTSNMFLGKALGKHVVQVAIPVPNRRGDLRVLVAVWPAEHFQQMIEAFNLPPDQIVAIFDPSHSVVALAGASMAVDKVRGKSVNKGLLKAFTTANEGTIETVNLQGQSVFNTFSISPTTQWGVAIAIPKQYLDSQLSASMQRWVGALLLILVASLASAWIMGGKIAKAVRGLQDSARALGAGRVVTIPPNADALLETQEVAQAMVSASEALNSSNALLVSSESRMRSILQSAPDAIITVDAAQRITLFNPAAARMFQRTPEQAIGMPLRTLLPEWSDPSGEFSGQTTGLRAGATFPVALTSAVVTQAETKFFTLIIRDISSQVQAQQELERSNADLKQFAFVASHDLKTPLRSIGGFVQMLGKRHIQGSDASGTSLIERTLKAVRRLELLTDDLLRYSRVDTAVPVRAPTDMAEVAREVVVLLDDAIQQAQGTVTLGALPTVMGHPNQLVQLLLNLVGNGLKYCQNRAPIVHLAAVEEDNAWVFSVTDNGIGISPEHLEKVFELFKRLHTHNEFEGTGIGLSVCKRIVDAHGGKIWVVSEPGLGSTFSFTLPK